jgi:nucleoid-associated protein YgaU
VEEYGFFLSFNNLQDIFRLPVNPETLEIKEAGDGKSYTIVDFGEINAIAHPKLTEITIESIFPAQRYPFVLVPETGPNRLRRPFEYVEMIKKRASDKKPPSTYTMKAGDNLWKIAQKVLGDGQKYKVIQKLNGISDDELRKLPVGKVLKMP